MKLPFSIIPELQGCPLFPKQDHKYPTSSLSTTPCSQNTTMGYSPNRPYPCPSLKPTPMSYLCTHIQCVTVDNQPTASPNTPSPLDRSQSAKPTLSLTPTPANPSITVNSPVAPTRKSGYKVSPMILVALHKEWELELKAPTPSYSSPIQSPIQ